ncbi:hypothetical protein, partial [Lacticaseibacillus sp. 866-1]|uniref:hypothetical protein n=1 Tax=Lacticaseibacillus sp. 866-1 TaxID=2799576 RepID=UPI00194148FF
PLPEAVKVAIAVGLERSEASALRRSQQQGLIAPEKTTRSTGGFYFHGLAAVFCKSGGAVGFLV